MVEDLAAVRERLASLIDDFDGGLGNDLAAIRNGFHDNHTCIAPFLLQQKRLAEAEALLTEFREFAQSGKHFFYPLGSLQRLDTALAPTLPVQP